MINKIPQVKFNPMNKIHENEVKVLNNLLKALDEKDNVDYEYDLLLEDVKNHFSFEENLMEKYNFFAKIPHKMEHDRIINELLEIKKLSNNEKKEYFYNYFIPWLENHINTMDTVTAGYFDMIGIKE